MNTPRLSGFYKLPLATRQEIAAEILGIPGEELRAALEAGGLDAQRADKTVENVIGTYSLPFALGLHFLINGRERVAPMVVEEPSVVAAASNAAKMVKAGGGFHAEADPPVMIAQIELEAVDDVAQAEASILREKGRLLALG
ncbi:MAG: 3-hydroxy-3-methylglutaryl-CoA reductase, partial [Myxococcales bacterium]|nr:3-hydroxy-3-methylglutaryl-CoA reductase [Myxococcales bacterium]